MNGFGLSERDLNAMVSMLDPESEQRLSAGMSRPVFPNGFSSSMPYAILSCIKRLKSSKYVAQSGIPNETYETAQTPHTTIHREETERIRNSNE